MQVQNNAEKLTLIEILVKCLPPGVVTDTHPDWFVAEYDGKVYLVSVEESREA